VPPEDQAYKSIKGARGLDGAQLGALRALAAWRQRTALARNKPLGWVVPDKAMVELCRRRARTDKDLRSVRGVGDGTIRRYGKAILEELARGAARPVEVDRGRQQGGLSSRGQLLASVISNLIQSRCAAEGLAPRFAGTRADAEALVAWFEDGAVEPTDLQLLTGWRREMIGDELVAFLRGDKAAVVTDGDAPLALRDLKSDR
jgi:ribonuclease D